MRILAIDGGGIRGLIPAIVLAEIEQRTGRPISELFDLIAGTSTGGILACALTVPSAENAAVPRYRAAELPALYETEGPKIFHRSLLKEIISIGGFIDERYDDDGLVDALTRYLGDARLKDTLVPILVTAYELHLREAFFFRTGRARNDPGYDFSLVDVARSTSAAPTYFEPSNVTAADGGGPYPLVDGGVYAVNPAMCAYADVARGGDIELLLSLGTGQLSRPIRYADARGWGQIQWARPIIDVVFDGVADTIEFEVGQLLPDGDYVRLQTELRRASDNLDDASPGNLVHLREEGEALVAREDATIDELCRRLTAPR